MIGGQLAQLDRALASGAKGRAFESRIAHHHIYKTQTHVLEFFLYDIFHDAFTSFIMLSSILTILQAQCIADHHSEVYSRMN